MFVYGNNRVVATGIVKLLYLLYSYTHKRSNHLFRLKAIIIVGYNDNGVCKLSFLTTVFFLSWFTIRILAYVTSYTELLFCLLLFFS